MPGKARVYCINHDCSKQHICARYASRPLNGALTRVYKEVWDGQQCVKFVPTVPAENVESFLLLDEPMKPTGRIMDPADIELREYLVKLVSDNFDKLFMRELSWNSGTAYNVPGISARVVDLIMPVVKRNMLARKR